MLIDILPTLFVVVFDPNFCLFFMLTRFSTILPKCPNIKNMHSDYQCYYLVTIAFSSLLYKNISNELF